MSSVSRPKRGRKGALRPDLSDLRSLMKDGRIWVQLGVVQSHGVGKHWERDDGGDILVEVLTVPRGIELVCRLGAVAGKVGAGVWRVPAVGTEVIVNIPDGEPDHHPAIVAVLTSGGAPQRVSDEMTLIAAPDAIELDAPAIRMGGEHAEKGAARMDDTAKLTLSPADLATLATALLTTGGFTPGTAVLPASSPVTFTDGQITSASDVVKVR